MKESCAGGGPIVIVHSLDHALAAVQAAGALGTALTLMSAPGAAAGAGAPWFREVARQAAAAAPAVEVTAVIDCGDQPGLVLAALRDGAKRLRFSGRKSVAEKLAAIAKQQQAVLLTGRLEALDLLDHPDPKTACRDWFARRLLKDSSP